MKKVGQIISSYRKKAKLTQPELAERLNKEGISLTPQAVSTWERGIAEPNVTTFLHLCRILQIPDCVGEFFGNNPSDPMSSLNDEGREMVKAYIRQLVSPVSYAKDPKVVSFTGAAGNISRESAVRYMADEKDVPDYIDQIGLYDESGLSAGPGEPVYSDRYTLMDVDRRVYPDADFAVPIHGTSMEPMFHDHAIAYVHRQDYLESGDYGAFIYWGEPYIKRWQDDENGAFLISENNADGSNPPKPVDPENDTTFRILGRICLPTALSKK